jgi:hypothetical protein
MDRGAPAGAVGQLEEIEARDLVRARVRVRVRARVRVRVRVSG